MVHVRSWFNLARHEDAPPVPPVPVPPVDPAPPAPADKPEDKPLGPNGEKALATERDARKAAEKAATELAAKVKEYEDKDKSDSEKAAERLAAAEKRATDAEAESLRLKVIAETGLPPELHEFLAGGDEAELRAKAEKLQAAVGAKPPAPPTQPKPDPSQGPKPPAPPEDLRTASAEEVKAARNALKRGARV